MKFEWQPNLKILAFAAIFFPLTIAAGFWQLSRAEEKRSMLDEQSARVNLPPVSIAQLDVSEEQNYRPVTVQGRWDSRYFLLENRVNNGRPGYEVLALFIVEDGTKVLVNRGWIQGDLDRSVLPDASFETAPNITLSGYAYRSRSRPFTLGEQIWSNQWPERIQTINWENIQSRLEEQVYPYLVRLDSNSDEALVTGWTIVNLPPQRHVGYAIQWFSLAFVLVILTIFANSNIGNAITRWFSKSSN